MQGQLIPPQQPTAQPSASSNNGLQVQQHILRELSQQPPLQGWQSSVQMQYRAGIIYQIFSQLRLLQSQLDLQYQLSLAIRFEAKAFTDAPDRTAYDAMCKRKLAEIHRLRTEQSAGMQQQMNMQMNMPQQMPNVAQDPSHVQGLGPAQFQQPPPNPQQQQMMQLHGMPMQQQQSQQPQPPPPPPPTSQQQGHQQQNMPMRQPPPNMPQVQPSTAPQRMVQQPSQFNPTPEENQYITRLANQMYTATPPQRIEAIRNNLRSMNADTRDGLARQGVDPMSWFFRTQAMKKFVDLKRAQAANQGLAGNQPTSNVNGVSRPMSQNAGGVPAQPLSGPQQNFEPPFDHIFGQQQDGLRSQEAGQIVVPASNAQAKLDQRNAARNNTQMNMQTGASRSLPNTAVNQPQPQPFWNQQPGQRNMNQGAGINASTQAANFANPNQAPANLLQGQPGGLDNQMTRTPSQQPGMPNLNKAAPPGQAPNMWPQGTPQQVNQPKPQATAMVPQASQQPEGRIDGPQQRPPIFQNIQNLPPQMQQRLLSMSEEQRRGFLISLQRRQMEQQQQQQQQRQLQQNQLQQQTQQQAAKIANARTVMNESFPMSSQPSQPGMQTGPTVTMSNQNISVQRPSMQNPNSQQPPFARQTPALGGPLRQQPGPGQLPPQQRGPSQYSGGPANAPLTEEQARQMDQKVFPSNLLSQGSQLLAQMPEDVRTWGQLKEYVVKNAPTLPSETLSKLEDLQAIQYRSQFQGPRPPHPGAVPPATTQPQAPFAQMVSQPNSQAPVQAPRPPHLANIPPPSFQEIQHVRANLPPNFKDASDDHVRAFIMRQRQEAMNRRMQAHQAQNAQMAQGLQKGAQSSQTQVQGPAGRVDPTANVQKGHAKGAVQEAQKVSNTAVNQSKQGQGNKNAPATKQAQKGTKRPSQDDVVEVPNPNLNNQAGVQAQNAVQASKQQPGPELHEQKAPTDIKGSSGSKNPITNQSQGADTQGARTGNLPAVSQEEVERRNTRLKQLMTEVGQNQPPRRPVPMTPQVRAGMAQRLGELSNMVERLEKSFPTYFRHNPDEGVAKNLIQTRQIIKAQYRDEQYNLIDNFTIGPNELEAAYGRIRQYFINVMEKFGSKRTTIARPGEQHQNQPQPQAQQPPVNQEKAPLNAANLEEQQNLLKAQRAASMQRHNSGHGSRAPPPPTSEKAPSFPHGPQSPHGIPHHFALPTLTADQLVLPNKRRRSNNHQPSAGSTPVLVPAQDTPIAKSSPLGPKLASPELPKARVPQMSFKCGISDCQSGQNGFATQAELEQHNADIHEPKEPEIEDPVEFALSSMRLALGLDENGKSKPRTETSEALKMKKSLSAQSYSAIKQEASTPMARAGTQTGPSPASNLLKTPQAMSSVKSPASDASKVKNGKGPTVSPKETDPPPFDPWAGSCISAEDIQSAWSSLADLNSMSFTKLQVGLTPSSTLSSGNEKSEKNSPRTSDISENDAVKISIDVGGGTKDDWIPSDWIDDTLCDIQSLNVGQDSFMGDGWDIFGDADVEMVDVGASTSRGKQMEEQDVIPEEWLKVYAPEKLPVKKGR
ncbi:MAG: hypothetical protein Q9224_002327 [Gallowayella concinna]